MKNAGKGVDDDDKDEGGYSRCYKYFIETNNLFKNDLFPCETQHWAETG